MPDFRILFTSLVILFGSQAVWADQHVFARQGDLVLTQDELDAAFAQIPEQYRKSFIRDGSRVDQLLQNLFTNKLLAADAAKNEFDRETVVVNRVKLAGEKELASAWLERVVQNAPPADFEALAHERYLANPEAYQTEAMVDVSHILIRSETRPEAEAVQMVNELRARLMEDPSRFDSFVQEYSEDPAMSSNQGRYPQIQRGQMVKPFEDMAFSMQNPGDISEPVKTSYGFHILRLNRKIAPEMIPFEQAKIRLMEAVRTEYLDDYRTRYLFKLVPEPIQIEEGAVEAMVKRHFGENLEGLPDFLR